MLDPPSREHDNVFSSTMSMFVEDDKVSINCMDLKKSTQGCKASVLGQTIRPESQHLAS